MGAKALINCHPKDPNSSKGGRHCVVCSKCFENEFDVDLMYFASLDNQKGMIRKYHLNMCRQCFRERAVNIGFIKVSV